VTAAIVVTVDLAVIAVTAARAVSAKAATTRDRLPSSHPRS
jgi:hypothetical protein